MECNGLAGAELATIRNIGRLGRDGMRQTDKEIVKTCSTEIKSSKCKDNNNNKNKNNVEVLTG